MFAALFELFDKADTGGDGTISIEEYVAMCDEYGIELTEDHMEGVRAIANEDGEVRRGRGASNWMGIKLGEIWNFFRWASDEISIKVNFSFIN